MASNYYNKVVVITGGSSGIGLSVARLFATEKALITLIARDKNKLQLAQQELEAISGDTVIDILPVNVSIKNEITGAINAIGEKFGKIDVLINCAGISTYGRFKDQPYEDLERCMQINYLGSMYASKAAWKFLSIAKGQLSFVSSVAGYLGVYGYSSYSPTKFAMTGLAEVLRFEGQDDGINVSIIYPPDTDTPLLQNSHALNIPECIALSKNIKVKSAEEVAKIYFTALKKNKFEIYCDVESKLIRWIKNNFTSVYSFSTNLFIKRSRRKKN